MANPNKAVWNARHSRPASPFTKNTLVDMMADEGWELRKGEVVDAGEWNERFHWQAVKGDQVVDLCSVFKGERVKWKDLFGTFHTQCVGMTWRQWEELAGGM